MSTRPPDPSRRAFLLGRSACVAAPDPDPLDAYFGSYEIACAQVNEARPFLADEAKRLGINTEGKTDTEILKAIFAAAGTCRG